MSASSLVPALDQPLVIERVEILTFDNCYFARARCGDHEGIAPLDHWTPALVALCQQLVLPLWVGRDARDLESTVGEIYLANANYKLAGALFWMAVAPVELAIWDALGQVTGQPVAALLNPAHKKKLPVYLSSPRRDTVAEAESYALDEAIARTEARAVKVKVGGRMLCDAQSDARDEAVLQAVRERWGDKFVIYADANGSFDAEKAIERGRVLERFQVSWFEEPCPWEDFEATRAVAAGVGLPVAGGKQDSSWPKWKWLLENCALDIAQPDLNYNGGLLRSFALAQFAGELGVLVAPHSPRSGAQALPALHFAAALEGGAPFLEWDASLPCAPSWCQCPEIRKGAVALPQKPGWGAVYDGEIWKRAEILASASV